MKPEPTHQTQNEVDSTTVERRTWEAELETFVNTLLRRYPGVQAALVGAVSEDGFSQFLLGSRKDAFVDGRVSIAAALLYAASTDPNNTETGSMLRRASEIAKQAVRMRTGAHFSESTVH